MDLDTSTLVAKVNTQALRDINLTSNQNTNFIENNDLSFEPSNVTEYENGDCDLDQEDYIISTSEVNCSSSKSIKRNNTVSDSSVDLPATKNCDSNYKKITFTDTDFLNGQTEYPFTACNIALNQYCETEVAGIIDDTTLIDKEYQHELLNSNNNADVSNNVLKYQNFVSSVTSNSAEFINPESILEENSELVDPQDQADYNAFNEFLNIPLTEAGDIAPHFIAGSFSDSDKQSLKENHLDSSDMGIENTWNEEFAVPSTSSFPLPLPAPPENGNFNEFSTCNNFDGVEHGSYTSDLEALFSTNETETDISDATADEGVCGLRNLGNTCFMSAGIQCLVATRSLVHFYKKLCVNDLDDNSLTMQFTELLHKTWSGQYSVVHPMKFKQALGVYYPQFKDCSQHDCQEFLALLLDALHQQLVAMPKEFFEENTYSYKDKIDNDVNMEVGIDCVSTSLPNTKCNSLYSYLNNNEITSSTNIMEEGSSLVNYTNENNNVVENSEMDLVSSYSPDENEADEQFTNSDKDSEETVSGNKLNHIEDILKETKTSNVNVLVTETEANNEICFDSEKFPKKERRRNIAETNYYDIYANDTNTASKDTGIYVDLKRMKVNRLGKEKNCLMENQNQQLEKNVRLENERKMKILNVDVKQSNKDENMMDTENDNVENTEEEEMRTEDDNDEVTSQMSEGSLQCADDIEAEKHWEKHVFNNRSVIFDSFQGQFKNTVVCSACNFKSITYEPFMYLSVPLPHAIEKQICVTFISANANPPVKYLITLTKQDEVSKIKQHLLKLITETLEYPIVIGEVLEYHITKILDDNHQIRYLDDVHRSVYAFEQLLVVPKDKDESATKLYNDHLNRGDNESANYVNETCSICLEEKESGVKRHKDCACILCELCIKSYSAHFGNSKQFLCPVCRAEINPETDLVPIEQSDMKSNLRLLNVPVVYRVDKMGDGNNNQKKIKLFGHPALLKLPNQIDTEELYEVVSSLHSHTEPFKLLLVDGQGRHCSRCMFNQHCKGCAIPRESHITLRSNDTLAVTFTDDITEVCEIRHPSMTFQRTHKTLSLYDCVQAFSQSEILDEFNPWYCPRCEKNQCATKTLSVWRFPKYLIVYLKRFVFHECTSIKLEDKVMFPLHGFNFNKKNESPYDLYACVCHTGGVSVGHYIAYTQHPLTSEWHCFNDENVSKQKPQEEEYCNAYILFYKKRNNNENDHI